MRWAGIMAAGMLWCGAVLADELALQSGAVYTGTFAGLENQHFLFETADGRKLREHVTAVKTIRSNPPPRVTVELLGERWDDVRFNGYEHFALTFSREGRQMVEPVTLVQRVELRAEPQVRPAAAPLQIISRGEVVEFEKHLRPGMVNIVHLHWAESQPSVRQGNYLETLAQRSRGRVQILRVIVPDWEAPICRALDIRSLPQFWFYDASGRLTKRLTDRFTDTDIDEALAQAGWRKK